MIVVCMGVKVRAISNMPIKIHETEYMPWEIRYYDIVEENIGGDIKDVIVFDYENDDWEPLYISEYMSMKNLMKVTVEVKDDIYNRGYIGYQLEMKNNIGEMVLDETVCNEWIEYEVLFNEDSEQVTLRFYMLPQLIPVMYIQEVQRVNYIWTMINIKIEYIDISIYSEGYFKTEQKINEAYYDGYNKGKEKGEIDGYEKGYADGISQELVEYEGQKNILTFVGSILGVIGSFFLYIFNNISFMGINAYVVISVVFSIVAVIFIFKMVF